eukprot:gene16876-biopygen4786
MNSCHEETPRGARFQLRTPS